MRVIVFRCLIAGLLVLATVMIASCATGPGPRAASGPGDELEGEWSDTSGLSVRFADGVFFTNAAYPGAPRYRYEVVSKTRLRLVPLVGAEGEEVEDEARARTETYGLDGDTLTLKTFGTFYRAGSTALAEALEAQRRKLGAQANTAGQRKALLACETVRQLYATAFAAWFDSTYPDRSSTGYTIGQYMGYRGVRLGWDFDELRATLLRPYREAVRAYEAEEIESDQEKDHEFLGWIERGVCPAGGTYRVGWDLAGAMVPQISCSIHSGGGSDERSEHE